MDGILRNMTHMYPQYWCYRCRDFFNSYIWDGIQHPNLHTYFYRNGLIRPVVGFEGWKAWGKGIGILDEIIKVFLISFIKVKCLLKRVISFWKTDLLANYR